MNAKDMLAADAIATAIETSKQNVKLKSWLVVSVTVNILLFVLLCIPIGG